MATCFIILYCFFIMMSSEDSALIMERICGVVNTQHNYRIVMTTIAKAKIVQILMRMYIMILKKLIAMTITLRILIGTGQVVHFMNYAHVSLGTL